MGGGTVESADRLKRIQIVLAGTGYDGRAPVIRQFAEVGAPVFLRRERANYHDPNAIAVDLEVSLLWGLWKPRRHIGYVPRTRAARLAPKIDSGAMVIQRAWISNLYGLDWKDFPDVTVTVEYVTLHHRHKGATPGAEVPGRAE